MASKKGTGCGTVIFIALLAGFGWASEHANDMIPFLGYAMAALLIVALVSALARPGICKVCGQRIQKGGGYVVVNGKKLRACSNCVRTVRAKVSRNAVKKLGI